jgi:transposase
MEDGMKKTTKPMTLVGVGIDTARYGHHVTFLREDRKPAASPLEVLESRTGYDKLQERLEQLRGKYPEASFKVHIDAAGQYAQNLETFLRSLDLPLSISVGEPKRNKDYHKAIFPKRSTDATESHAMARFALVEQPQPTLPIPGEFYILREIVSRLEGQVKDTTRTTNRLHNVLARVFPELATIVDDISAVSILKLLHKYPTAHRIAAAHLSSIKQISYLREDKAVAIHEAAKRSVASLQGELTESLIRQSVERVQECLQGEKKLETMLLQAYHALPKSGHTQIATILGIGEVTAAVIVAKSISIERFETPEKLVGYFGVFPEENTSGFDRRGKSVKPGSMQMSAKGSDVVRRYLWNAAMSAIQSNPAVRSLYQRLVARGKRGDVALGHCMRKLLHLVYAVWSTNMPFDPKHYDWEPAQPTKANEISDPSETASQQAVESKEGKLTKEMAAGHKRDIIPIRKVVTATDPTIEAAVPAVNKPKTNQNRSQSVNYAFLRQQISFEKVLTHLGHREKMRGSRSDLRGPCPIHKSEKTNDRSFSVNLDKNVFKCFRPSCKTQGNVLDFWAAVHQQTLHQAALHLAETFDLPIQPEQRRGARNEPVKSPKN